MSDPAPPPTDPPEPTAGYDTVSDPERYRVLHDAARLLLAELVRDYDVTRQDGHTTDPSRRAGRAPVVDLQPARPGVGRLRIVFTAFPGIFVQLGQEPAVALPACGCDACDEDPDDLIDDLHDLVGALTGAHTPTRTTRWRSRADPGG